MKDCKCEGNMCECNRPAIKQIKIEEQKRAQEDGFTSRKLQEIHEVVKNTIIALLDRKLNEVYLNAWKEGFMVGIENPRNNDY